MSKTTNHGPGVRCPNCGATLDYGERCDCERRETEARKDKRLHRARKELAQNVEAYEKGWEEYLYA